MNRLNCRGAVFSYIAIGIILLISSASLLILRPIMKSVNTMNNIEVNIEIEKDKRISTERAFAKAIGNISYEGIISHKDINRKSEIRELNRNEENMSVKGGRINSVNIDNQTDINVTVELSPLEEYYSVVSIDLLVNGKKVYDFGFGENIGVDSYTIKTFNIPKEFIYNKSSDRNNYGKYEVVVNQGNIDVSSEINYTKVIDRDIEITEVDTDETEDKVTHKYKVLRDQRDLYLELIKEEKIGVI